MRARRDAHRSMDRIDAHKGSSRDLDCVTFESFAVYVNPSFILLREAYAVILLDVFVTVWGPPTKLS